MDKVNWTWLHREMDQLGVGDTEAYYNLAVQVGMNLAVVFAHRIVQRRKQKAVVNHDSSSVSSQASKSVEGTGSRGEAATSQVETGLVEQLVQTKEINQTLEKTVRDLEEKLSQKRSFSQDQESENNLLRQRIQEYEDKITELTNEVTRLEESLNQTKLLKVQEVTELKSQLYQRQSLESNPTSPTSTVPRQKSPSRRSKSPTWKRTSHTPQTPSSL